MGYITSLFARVMIDAALPESDRPAFLCSVGLDPGAETDPKQMLADADYYDLLERIAARTDATDLPLRAARLLRPDDYGALGLAWKAAPTLRGSYARVERFARLWTSVVEYELRNTDRGTVFVLHRAGPRRLGLRLSNEATLASTVSISRQVSPPPAFTPVEAHFRHPAPASLRAHAEFFGCPLCFGSDMDALVIAHETLDRPNILGDEGITRFLLSHLEQELRTVGADVSLESLTKDAIARSLSEGLPRMADIARGLGMSARSFHRRLSEHGQSFQSLTEETRRDLAEGLLRDDRYSLSEVAFLTGFSEQSSFTRAFKRWCGMTPANYRKAKMQA